MEVAPRVWCDGGAIGGEEKGRGGTLATDVNAGGSDATIAVMRSHYADLGTSSDGAGGDSFTRLGVAGARCRMDRDRTAT